MSFPYPQTKVPSVVGLVLILITLVSTPQLVACPQETVSYPSFTLPQLKGRLLPPDGDELLPNTRVTFIIRAKGNDSSEQWDVPVSSDGTFVVGLPEGTYEFKIQLEGFLFTLVGDVIISSESSVGAAMEIKPPWC